jgi:hypothetical protein
MTKLTRASDATAYLLVEAGKHGGPRQDQTTIAAAQRFAQDELKPLMAHEHPLNKSYDEGSRDALLDLVRATVAAAKRQVKRSSETLASPDADSDDAKEHAYDVTIHEALTAVLACPR